MMSPKPDINRAKLNSEEIQFSFETLLSRISTAFINIKSDDIDDRIVQALEELGKFMDVDRAYIMLYAKDRKTISETHTWTKENISNTLPKFQKLPVKEYPWFTGIINQGEPVFINDRIKLSEEGRKEIGGILEKTNAHAVVSVPLLLDGEVLGFVAFDDCRAPRNWSPNIVVRMKLVGEIFASTISRKESEQALIKAYEEVQKLKERLEIENTYLKEEIKLNSNFENIIGWSGALKKTLRQIEQVAPIDSTVLVLGETGTGKELMARAIHNLSRRKDFPLVKVNCAALPAYLIESELFGHEKGAFTGAIMQHIGRFELANGGTIFLDEIGEMPMEAQVKLLRVLQEGEFERVGNPKTFNVDVRVIAATNRNLQEEIKRNNFRKDLFYRLNIFPIHIPPLRERKEDIPYLVRAFVSKVGKKIGKSIDNIPSKVIQDLQSYHFPGNVRELENIIERAVIISSGTALELGDWNLFTNNDADKSHFTGTLKDVECKYITQTLKDTNWKIEGANGASNILGLNPSTLRSKMVKLGIKKPKLGN